MKMIIAILVFLMIFGLSGYYIYTRITQAFQSDFLNSKLFLIFYIILLASFFLGKSIENYSIGFISNSFVRIGAISSGFFFYALLFVAFFDLLRLINYIIPYYPKFITEDYQKAKSLIGLISIILISAINVIGYYNAIIPKVKNIEISINKKQLGFNTLNVVAVSDIHLGTMVNELKTKLLISLIKEQNPDLIILGGDLIDDNLKVVKYFKLLDNFKELKPKYGVYSCLGNHEYISKAYEDLDFFKEKGINMLRDTTVKVDDKFYIIGRDDIQLEKTFDKKRKSLKELTKDVDFKFPVFLLDHQPYKLEETAKYDVDLQFSGHTHNGQIFPFNYITGLLFEEDWGHLKKKNTNFYISSGFGTAVMPIRVGSRSEIVNIKITNN
ncbi:MAG: hypothetical protein B6I24_00055 [Bacteroidetes bacterium 4572_128]|nr:MAG: hypothetical protein B6I24_00055 [Bacteroidetes bacterium 4572_128]